MTSPISSQVLAGLSEVARRIGEADAKRAEDARQGKDFNVFTTLLKEDDEVRLHTRFLHCLLNPLGKHGQGERFLSGFIEVLRERGAVSHSGGKEPLDVLPAVSSRWTVEKEKRCGSFGQIDLLLCGGGFAIAIENKLNAAEQDHQIEDYAAYLEKRVGERGRLFYLTKDGKAARTHGGRRYHRISYKEHIRTWLARCLKDFDGRLELKVALEQYSQVVDKLVESISEAQTMCEVSDYIAQHSVLIQYRQVIKKALDQARRGFVNALVQKITEALGDDFNAVFRPPLPWFGDHSEGTVLLEPKNSSTLAKLLPAKLAVQHWVNGESLLIGLECAEKPSTEQSAIFEKMAANLRAADDNRHEATPTWPVGWSDLITGFNDEKIAELMRSGSDSFAEGIAQKLRVCIKALEDAYRDTIKR